MLLTRCDCSTGTEPGGEKLYSISGNVLNRYEERIAGVTITLTGDDIEPLNTTTDSEGEYIFKQLMQGIYTVTPSKEGYTFNPPNYKPNLDVSSIQNDFICSIVGTYIVSGTFIEKCKDGDENIITYVELAGTENGFKKKVLSDNPEVGHYRFYDVFPGTYTLTPSFDDFTFTPESVTITVGSEDYTVEQIVGLFHDPDGYIVSGKVFGLLGDIKHEGIPDVTVVIIKSDITYKMTVTYDEGVYEFYGIPDGHYFVSAQSETMRFVPKYREITINGGCSQVNLDEGYVDYEVDVFLKE